MVAFRGWPGLKSSESSPGLTSKMTSLFKFDTQAVQLEQFWVGWVSFSPCGLIPWLGLCIAWWTRLETHLIGDWLPPEGFKREEVEAGAADESSHKGHPSSRGDRDPTSLGKEGERNRYSSIISYRVTQQTWFSYSSVYFFHHKWWIASQGDNVDAGIIPFDFNSYLSKSSPAALCLCFTCL